MQQQRYSPIQSLANVVLNGPLQAVLAVALFMFVPFLSWMSSIIIALVTLRQGSKRGGILLLWAVFLTTVIASYFMAMPWAVINAISSYGLVYISAFVLRKTLSWSASIQSVFMLVAVSLLILYSLHPDAFQAFQALMVKQMGYLEAGGDELYSPQLLQSQLSSLMTHLLGIYALFLCLTSFLNLLIARNIQAQLFNPGGLGDELREIRVSGVYTSVALACTGMAFYLDSRLGVSVALIVSMAYVFAALSLLHSLGSQRIRGRALYIGFYIVLLLCIPYSLIPVIALGVVDSGYDIRKKFSYSELTTE